MLIISFISVRPLEGKGTPSQGCVPVAIVRQDRVISSGIDEDGLGRRTIPTHFCFCSLSPRYTPPRSQTVLAPSRIKLYLSIITLPASILTTAAGTSIWNRGSEVHAAAVIEMYFHVRQGRGQVGG